MSIIAATAVSRNSDQPFAFAASDKCVAMVSRQLLPDRDQIVARIKPFGNIANVLAQRLAITQMHRPGEDIDLPASIIDIIFADDLMPGKFEQAGQRIANHSAPAMAHMHRPGGIGGDIFDIDRLARAQIGTAIIRRLASQSPPIPSSQTACIQPQIDKARPGNLN